MPRTIHSFCEHLRTLADIRCGPRASRRAATQLEFLPEDGVAIAQQVARDLLTRKRFPQLLSGPFRRWMGGHIAMKNASTVMRQKYVDNTIPRLIIWQQQWGSWGGVFALIHALLSATKKSLISNSAPSISRPTIRMKRTGSDSDDTLVEAAVFILDCVIAIELKVIDLLLRKILSRN